MASKSGRKPYFFYGYIIALAGFLISAILWGSIYTFGVFLKSISAEFGWTRAVTSSSYSMFMVVHGLISMIVGRLTDRFGPRIVVTVCGVFLGMGFLLMSQITSLWQIYLIYGVLVAVGASGGFVPLASTTAKWFVKRRGLMTGIVLSGVGAGVMIGTPAAGWLISSYGWRDSYFAIGIGTLVLFTLIAQLLRRDPGVVGQLPDGESEVKKNRGVFDASGLSPREAMRTRQFWMIFTIYISYGIILQAILVHIVAHATDLGIPALRATNILALIGAVQIAGRIGLLSSTDRIGSRRGLIIGYCLLMVSLFSLQFAKELWVFYLFAVIFGLAYGGIGPIISPLVAELFGTRMHGAILGIFAFAWAMGSAFGPTMAGYIFDITNSYYPAFWFLTALSIISLILTLLLKPIPKKS